MSVDSAKVIASLILLLLAAGALAGEPEEPVLIPEIAGDWWQVAGDPDLAEWTSQDQQPVDFGVWQAADGTWQLWSCIRKTKCGGNTRLFYGWEGRRLTDKNWRPKGIAMVADPNLGETPGGLQAPHVIADGGAYFMFYGDWRNICLAKSDDGRQFVRAPIKNGLPQLFTEDRPDGEPTNTRDAMVLKAGDTWYCYYTAYPGRKGAVYCRTSANLHEWSESKIVSAGGSSGDNAWSAECPQVVYHQPSRHFYLWRTQRYGQNAQSSVYRSKDPLDFGPGGDDCLVCRMPVAAPELVHHQGQWYMAALLPSLKGIQIAPLRWTERRTSGG